MSKIEIILIVLACAVPLVAFIFVAPKFKKKEKTKVEASTKTYEEMKKEETPKEEVKPEPAKEKKAPKFESTDFGPNDFRSYLNHKQQTTTKPTRVNLPDGFQDKTMPYMPRRGRALRSKSKTVAEEIRSLSPELKALIFTGALDKKKFDCD